MRSFQLAHRRVVPLYCNATGLIVSVGVSAMSNVFSKLSCPAVGYRLSERSSHNASQGVMEE